MKIFLKISLFLFCMYGILHVKTLGACPARPEEDIRYLGTWVNRWFCAALWLLVLYPLEEQHVFLTAELQHFLNFKDLLCNMEGLTLACLSVSDFSMVITLRFLVILFFISLWSFKDQSTMKYFLKAIFRHNNSTIEKAKYLNFFKNVKWQESTNKITW